MDNIDKWVEYAPVIIVVLLYIAQNNLYIKPEQLEKKHREIIEEVEKKFSEKFVELNAYKEFQNRVYSTLDKLCNGFDELKNYIMKGSK